MLEAITTGVASDIVSRPRGKGVNAYFSKGIADKGIILALTLEKMAGRVLYVSFCVWKVN